MPNTVPNTNDSLQSPKKAKKSLWIKIPFLLAAFAIVFILSAFFLIQTQLPPQKIQKETEVFLTQQLKRPAKIDGVGF